MKHNKNIRQTIKKIDARREKWDYIKLLRDSLKDHPMYTIAQQEVDRLFDSSYYEHGEVVGISPTRVGFDDLHENYSDLYRGGFEEIQVGGHYIIYGFEFD
jgi:cupin superfamily acireductone dioxygenase involved in methionine salvage